MADIFDLADYDESGEIDEREFRYIVRKLKKSPKKMAAKKIHQVMKRCGARLHKISPTKSMLMLSRQHFLKALAEKENSVVSDGGSNLHISHLISDQLAYQYLHGHQLASSWYSAAIQLLLLFHAPVSARGFYYFDCHQLGARTYLRRDYNTQCFGKQWTEFLPVAIILLVGFAATIPIGLTFILYYNRKHLYTPSIRVQIGFLYSRYVPGAEWWEIHEVIRKMFLCGLLVYLPATTRAAAAVLICVLALASLNYTRPHKNNYLFWACQGAFMLTACKYLTTIFAKAMGRNLEQSEDDEMLAYFLIFFDSMIFVFGGFCIVAIVCMLFQDVRNLRKTGKIDAHYDEDTEFVIQKLRRLTAAEGGGGSVKSRRASAMLLQDHLSRVQNKSSTIDAEIVASLKKTNSRSLTSSKGQASLGPASPRLLSAWTRVNDVGRLVDHGKVFQLEESAEKARVLHLNSMEAKHVKAKKKMMERVEKRTSMVSAASNFIVARRAMCNVVQTEERLDFIMKKLTQGKKSGLNHDEFIKFVSSCVKKSKETFEKKGNSSAKDQLDEIWVALSRGSETVDKEILSTFLFHASNRLLVTKFNDEQPS